MLPKKMLSIVPKVVQVTDNFSFGSQVTWLFLTQSNVISHQEHVTTL